MSPDLLTFFYQINLGRNDVYKISSETNAVFSDLQLKTFL